MSTVQTLPVRIMLVESNRFFRSNPNKPALAFALLRRISNSGELVVIVNNLICLHYRVTSPYHYYEGWFEDPETGIAVSAGVFNTDPEGKGALLYRFDPLEIAGFTLGSFKNIFITAERQDGNPSPGTRVLG